MSNPPDLCATILADEAALLALKQRLAVEPTVLKARDPQRFAAAEAAFQIVRSGTVVFAHVPGHHIDKATTYGQGWGASREVLSRVFNSRDNVFVYEDLPAASIGVMMLIDSFQLGATFRIKPAPPPKTPAPPQPPTPAEDPGQPPAAS